jgi:two-component system OmpR family response regulator
MDTDRGTPGGAAARALRRDHRLDGTGFITAVTAVDVQILRLRRKIEPNPSRPLYINTERGAGYVFCVPVEVLE